MRGENVLEPPGDAAGRDSREQAREHGFKKFYSDWMPIDAGGSQNFTHSLNEVPLVVDVLTATDAHGTGVAQATSVTVTKTDKIVTVQNGGTAAYFQVRAI